jgi:hypothetical protein
VAERHLHHPIVVGMDDRYAGGAGNPVTSERSADRGRMRRRGEEEAADGTILTPSFHA